MKTMSLQLRTFEEAVEEKEEKDRDNSVDKGADSEVHVEPGFGLPENPAARQGDQALMYYKEASRKREACGRMLSVQP